MPLSSAVAAVAGVLLLFWQRVVGYARRMGRAVRGLLARLRR